MQALYGFFQTSGKDMLVAERELLSALDKVYDLYISQLALIIELKHVATTLLEEAKTKHLATAEQLNPSLKFVENKFIQQLSENIHLKREIHNRKISWNNEFELVKKLMNAIRSSNEYITYMTFASNSYQSDKDFILQLFTEHIADFELLNHHYGERFLHWEDDLYMVNPSLQKSMESFTENGPADFELMPLYKDAEDDKQFVIDLFRNTIIKNAEIEKLIGDKTKNWEVERIAFMDVLLMKMAISETMQFPSIPIKVSLNEYIEISKMFSTPKSKMFINGILDKIITDLKREDKIVKTGRGLME
jgi:N utilization substance protein B